MKICAFDWKDFDAVLEFHKEIHAELYTTPFDENKVKAVYNDFYENARKGMLVAEENGKIVGNILLKIEKSKYTGVNVCHVSWVFVKKDFRNKGIGNALLNEAEKFAKAHGIEWLTLNTNIKNQEALDFYKAQGFEEFQLRMRKKIQ